MSQTYQIITLNPKAVPAAGNRLAVIRFRGLDGKPTKQSKMCEVNKLDQVYVLADCQLSTIHESAELSPTTTDALSVLCEAVETQQDNVIRQRVEAGITTITQAELEVPQMLAQLCAESVSKRLTKDAIEGWVRGPLGSFVAERALETMPETATTDIQKTAHAATVLQAYVDNMCKLAATVPALHQAKCEMLRKMITRSQLTDPIAKACEKKLVAMLTPQVDTAGAL